MSDAAGSRLVVERVDAVPGRPWVLVSGRLAGDPLRVGATVTIRYGDRVAVPAVIRTIEMHTRPGVTTIAIDADLRDALGPGAEVSATDS
jgi:hypothetical protein